jgi:MFS family permease
MPGLGRRGAAVLTLLCVAQFVDVLGVTVVVVALPSIQRDLGFSPAGLQWVVSTYALLFGGFLMLSGRAADLYGRRRLFMTGLGVFAVASLACGLARSAPWLVVARAAQGLGGLLTQGLGWRWVFLVNLPVIVLGLVVAPVLIGESRDPAANAQLDLLGAVTVTAGLIALIYGLTRAEDTGFASAGTIAAVAGAAVLLAAFPVVERRVAGLLAVTAAMLLVTAISAGGGVAYLVIGLSLAGAGLGCASVAATATGTAAVSADRQGFASGLLNTAAQIGTAIGIAALATLAAARTQALAVSADPSAAQLVAGFRLAFLVAAALSVAGCLVAFLLVQRRSGKERAERS